MLAPRILKPDITTPGVEILAAFLPVAPVSSNASDKRSVKYTVLSGTSMACPHVGGAAAYLKSLHPDWSPAAIKSALMTTAHPMSPSKNPNREFAYGSGHLNPAGTANPGLVFETTKDDYIGYLCATGYGDEEVRLISGDKKAVCPKETNESSPLADLNYPSMSTKVRQELTTIKFHGRVTNVGVANSTYIAKVESEPEIKVTMEPSSLLFKSLKEEKYVTVTVVGNGTGPFSASVVWSDGIHTVRSPIIVYGDLY